MVDIEKAKWFAKIKHNGQIRKTGEPYVNHPIRVAEIIKRTKPDSSGLDILMASAYLHDTVEDTYTSPKEIEDHFGQEVSSTVLELSSAPFASDYYGKEKYLAGKMKLLTPYALLIKLADRLDNIRDMSPEIFKPEKRLRKFAETINILKHLKTSKTLTQHHLQLIAEIEIAMET
ncbi:MAG: HD domain-containing protein [Firmicutes bacterium]|nr:HD domain-containing protein [Bacillota bacterium]